MNWRSTAWHLRPWDHTSAPPSLLLAACPVCYLPLQSAVAAEPSLSRLASQEPVLRQLSYVTEEDEEERRAVEELNRPPLFGGHQTMQQRKESLRVAEDMKVHCGYVALVH